MVIIALIGIDGCGKTTQAKILLDNLIRDGFNAIYLQPILVFLNHPILSKIKQTPWCSPRISATKKENTSKYGFIYRILITLRSYMLYLFGYFYALFLYLYIRYLSIGHIVICDRFFYQFFYDIYGNYSLSICKYFPHPDLTFFLDIQPQLTYCRMTSDYDKTVKLGYYINVAKLYYALFNNFNFNKIDANLPSADLAEKIFVDTKKFILMRGISEYA